jgi:hypothetical protein
MRYLLDAIICGPAAVGEYIVNGACEALANTICFITDLGAKSEKKAAEKKEAAKETAKDVKAEIIEFVQEKNKINSMINAESSDVDEDEMNLQFTEDQISNYVEDIVEKVSSFHYRILDGNEIIIYKDHFSCILCNLCSTDTHSNTDVCSLK